MCQAFLKPCVSTDASLSLPADAAHGQDCVIGGPVPADADLHKPLPHGYKLRNFYTRQYLKQSCSFPPEEPLQSSVPAADSAHPCGADSAHPPSSDSAHPLSSDSAHPLRSDSAHQCSSDSAHPPSSNSAHPLSSDSAHPCGSDSAHLHVLQPKKTVYLKKFNYLRSHVSAEDEGVEEATPTCPTHATASDLSMTSDPAEVSELKTTPVAEPDNPRDHVERSEVSSGNKYCCEVCGKTFKHPSNLELHKRSHTGQTHTHTHTHTLSLTHSLSLSHTHTHNHIHTLSCSLSLTHSQMHTHSLTLTHTHCLFLSLAHTHKHTHAHILSHSLTCAHTHTHSLSHTALMQPLVSLCR